MEQLRPLTVAMMGRNKVGVTTFYFYIHVLICIENMQQCCYIITLYHMDCTVIFHIFTKVVTNSDTTVIVHGQHSFGYSV